jgi:hypothetical protein
MHGYSPCFLAKNDPKCMFLQNENNLKRVKIPQNPSKPWAIVHGLIVISTS